jgi:hypothetical protein
VMIARLTITKPARWLRREQREPLNDTRNEPCGSPAVCFTGFPQDNHLTLIGMPKMEFYGTGPRPPPIGRLLPSTNASLTR